MPQHDPWDRLYGSREPESQDPWDRLYGALPEPEPVATLEPEGPSMRERGREVRGDLVSRGQGALRSGFGALFRKLNEPIPDDGSPLSEMAQDQASSWSSVGIREGLGTLTGLGAGAAEAGAELTGSERLRGASDAMGASAERQMARVEPDRARFDAGDPNLLERAGRTISQGVVTTLPALGATAAATAAGLPAMGVMGAGLAAGYGMGLGDIQNELTDQGMDPGSASLRAAGGAVPYAALERIVPGRVVGNVAGRVGGRVVGETARGVVTEGITEGAQSALSQGLGTEGIRGIDWSRAWEEAKAGALTGGFLGGVSAVSAPGQEGMAGSEDPTRQLEPIGGPPAQAAPGPQAPVPGPMPAPAPQVAPAPAQTAPAPIPEVAPEPEAREVAPWASRTVESRQGREGSTLFPGDNRKLRTSYRVMEADDLRASHTPEYSQRPPEEFPPEIQGRAYHGPRGRQAREHTEQIVSGFDPDRALDPTLSAAEGPPVVTPSGVAVSGNGRIISLQRLPDETAQAYRARLEERAEEFGIDPAELQTMRRPVLVRQIDDPDVDVGDVQVLRGLNQSSDVPTGKTKDVLSDAQSRASRQAPSPDKSLANPDFLAATTTRTSERLPSAGTFAMEESGQPAPKPTKIVKELQGALSKALQGVKVAEGRLPKMGFGGERVDPLGVFHAGRQVIRLGDISDLRVFGHEAGHAMQQVIFQDAKPGALTDEVIRANVPGAVRGEMEDLAKGISNESLREGWAELWRRYLDNPESLETEAPNALGYVHTRMESHPELMAAWNKARDDWRLYREAGPQARVRSRISVNEKPENLGTRDKLRKLRTDVLDDFAPLSYLTQAIRERGHVIETDQDAEQLARLTRGSTGMAEAFLENGVLDYATLKVTGPSFQSALEPVKEQLDDFRDYLVARRTIELSARDIGTGVRPEDARWVVDELEARFGERFKEAADRLAEYQSGLLTYLSDAGVLSREAVEKIEAANMAYVPFYRVMDSEATGRLGLGFGNLFDPIKRIKGSGRDIIDPLESIVKNTYEYVNLAARQQVSFALHNLAQKEGLGDLMEPLVKPVEVTKFKLGEIQKQLEEQVPGFADLVEDMDPATAEETMLVFRPGDLLGRPNTISVLIDGKRQHYDVDPELYGALEGMGRESLGMMGRLLAKPASLLRAGATLAPEFQLRNPLRDQVMAYVQSEYGYTPFVDLGRGLFELVRKGEAYEQWRASGGQRASLLGLDRKTMQNHIRELTRSGGVPNVLKNPLDMLRAISALMEDGSRMGEFMNARKVLAERSGVSEADLSKDDLQQAASAAREISVDFARHGAKMTGLRASVAFWNARLQGYDRLARAAKRNPVQFAAKSFAAITLPSLMEYFANRDDPEYWEIPQWQRDLFWVWKIRDTWVRIPKPFELGLIFGTLPVRILQSLEQQGHAGEMDQFFRETMVGEVTGIAPIPTALGPVWENLTNYSMFLRRPIVPRSEEDVRAEFQFGEHTSEAAKMIGRWAPGDGISPRKIDNLLFAWTGGLGRLATQVGDRAVRVGDETEEPKEPLPERIPGIRGIVARNPGFSSEAVERFYQEYEKARTATSTLRELEKRGDDEAARKELENEEYRELRDLEPMYRRTASALSELRQEALAVRRDDRYSGEEKQKRLERLGREAMNEARRALGMDPIREDRP